MKNKIAKYYFLYIAILIAGTETVYSQDCCSSGAPLLGSMELATAQSGFWQVAVSYRFNSLDDLYWGKTNVHENFRQRQTGSITAEINYGLGNNFTAIVLSTFVQQERTIQPAFAGGTSDYIRVRGMSDLIIMLKYSLLPLNLATQRELSVGIGTKLPTGSNEVLHNGIPVSYDLQPGTGATDVILWSYFFQGFQPKPYQINGVFSYRITGDNKQKYRFGNEWVISAGMHFRLNHFANLTAQLRYRKTSPDRFQNQEIPNTGGNWFYLIPGINIPFNSRLTVRTAVEIPVYRNLNGIQLTTTYAASLTVFYSFNLF